MNSKKMCFIICYNNELYLNECIFYIQNLELPDGFEIDVLSVKDAKSMTSGYNEAMKASDAKYKVYLHQDVFIINKNFIKDVLNIFMNDKNIGMIGNIGCENLPKSAIMWKVDRVGALYDRHIYQIDKIYNFPTKRNYEVEAIDGFIMITQYDLKWREDLFDRWHFYDVSQSAEFRRAGYKVIVPYMNEPWCVHDAGVVDLEGDYEVARQRFIKEYKL